MGRDSRLANVRLGVESRDYDRGLRDAEKKAQTWGQRVKGHITKSLRGAFGGLGGITGLAGIAGFGALARDVKVFNDRLVRLQISSGKTRGEMLKFNAALQATAQATGAQQDDLLAGAEKYQELTGRFEEFTSAMDSFAKVQVATGASMDDIATAAAALSDNLGVRPEEMMNTFDILAVQGKKGAVELRNLAQELAGVTGQFALFGEKGPQGAAQLGAWLQVLRKGAPSAAEAATQLEALMGAIRMSHDTLRKKFGINVWADKTKTTLRGLDEITTEILQKIPMAKWGDVFGRKEAQNALITFRNNQDAFDELVKSGGDGRTIMADFATQAESAGGKMAKAKAHFLAVFNEALIKNLDAIVTAFEALVKALSWMAQHPEALAGLALLWKGGGFLSTVGALGGAAGGGGGMGALGAAAASAGGGAGGSRAAQVVGVVGGMMQGAAVGFAMSEMGKTVSNTDDELDDLASVGSTAAGALASLPGPLGLLGKGLLAAKMATDIYIGGIDRHEAVRATRTLDDFFLERGRGLGIGHAGQELFAPRMLKGERGDEQRSNAKSILQEAMTQGFLKRTANGSIQMDHMAMQSFVNSQPGWDDEKKQRASALFGRAFDLEQMDPQLQDFVTKGLWGSRAVFGGQPGLTPDWQGGDWQEQLAPTPFVFGSQTESGGPAPPVEASSREVRIRIIPTEGISAVVENDKKLRRRGGR